MYFRAGIRDPTMQLPPPKLWGAIAVRAKGIMSKKESHGEEGEKKGNKAQAST